MLTCVSRLAAPSCFCCARAAMATSDNRTATPPPKRSRFSFGKCAQMPASVASLPDLNRLTEEVATLPVPKPVMEKLQGPSLFIGIDVETHALVPRRPNQASFWRTGEFGFLTTADDEALSFLRLVQLGWAYMEDGSDEPVVKTCLIKPEGFTIESAATEKHGIKNSEAVEHGQPLAEVLLLFLKDLTSCLEKGYRICAHHLGFDAGILSREMARVSSNPARDVWDKGVREGLCPDMCHWVRQFVGIGDKPRSIPMRLRHLVMVLLPRQAHLLARSHTAGADAHMHLLIARELQRRAVSRVKDDATR